MAESVRKPYEKPKALPTKASMACSTQSKK